MILGIMGVVAAKAFGWDKPNAQQGVVNVGGSYLVGVYDLPPPLPLLISSHPTSIPAYHAHPASAAFKRPEVGLSSDLCLDVVHSLAFSLSLLAPSSLFFAPLSVPRDSGLRCNGESSSMQKGRTCRQMQVP
jgi:hypothetical protein